MLDFLGEFFYARPGSIKEALSVPFQQTARYVKYYGNEVTEVEKEAINDVLEYDFLKEHYNPRISDPVKDTYKKDVTKLGAYFQVWLQQFFKHPACYIQATWEQIYYLFVPENDNIVLYQDTTTGYEMGNVVYIPNQSFYEPIFTISDMNGLLQKWLVKELQILHNMPILYWFGNISIWMYLFCIAIVVSIVHKCEWKTTGLPLMISFVFIKLGPAIQGHPRYMFPIIYALPIWIAYIMFQIKKVEKNDRIIYEK